MTNGFVLNFAKSLQIYFFCVKQKKKKKKKKKKKNTFQKMSKESSSVVPSLYGCPLGFMFVFGSHGSCLDASIAVISLQELPNLFSVSFSACYVCVLFDCASRALLLQSNIVIVVQGYFEILRDIRTSTY